MKIGWAAALLAVALLTVGIPVPAMAAEAEEPNGLPQMVSVAQEAGADDVLLPPPEAAGEEPALEEAPPEAEAVAAPAAQETQQPQEAAPVGAISSYAMQMEHNFIALSTEGGQAYVDRYYSPYIGDIVTFYVSHVEPGYYFFGWEFAPDSALGESQIRGGSLQSSQVQIENFFGEGPDVTLTAYFVPQQYKVFFDSQGGTQIDPQHTAYKDLVARPANPLKSGYQFSEWNNQPDGSGMEWVFETETMPAADVTLYAQWQVVEEEKEETETPGSIQEDEESGPGIPDENTQPPVTPQPPITPQPPQEKPGTPGGQTPETTFPAEELPGGEAQVAPQPEKATPTAAKETPVGIAQASTENRQPPKAGTLPAPVIESPAVGESAAAKGPVETTEAGGERSGVVDTEGLPMAGVQSQGEWALLNLILALGTLLAGLTLLLAKSWKKQNGRRRILLAGVLPAAVGIVSALTFLLTENLSLPMTLSDMWTPLMIVLAALETVLVVIRLAEKRKTGQNKAQ